MTSLKEGGSSFLEQEKKWLVLLAYAAVVSSAGLHDQWDGFSLLRNINDLFKTGIITVIMKLVFLSNVIC